MEDKSILSLQGGKVNIYEEVRMDFKKIYNLFEDDIEELTETTEAEASANALLSKLKGKDTDLFFELDIAIGTLVRAYEKQGFAGGIEAARKLNMT